MGKKEKEKEKEEEEERRRKKKEKEEERKRRRKKKEEERRRRKEEICSFFLMEAIIVTGASQGLGRAICVELATALSKTDRQCVFYLLARNSQGLKDTASEVCHGKTNLKGRHSLPLQDTRASLQDPVKLKDNILFCLFLLAAVVEYPIDLGDLGGLEANLEGLFSLVFLLLFLLFFSLLFLH